MNPPNSDNSTHRPKARVHNYPFLRQLAAFSSRNRQTQPLFSSLLGAALAVAEVRLMSRTWRGSNMEVREMRGFVLAVVLGMVPLGAVAQIQPAMPAMPAAPIMPQGPVTTTMQYSLPLTGVLQGPQAPQYPSDLARLRAAEAPRNLAPQVTIGTPIPNPPPINYRIPAPLF
jgi:hypothetical protein